LSEDFALEIARKSVASKNDPTHGAWIDEDFLFEVVREVERLHDAIEEQQSVLTCITDARDADMLDRFGGNIWHAIDHMVNPDRMPELPWTDHVFVVCLRKIHQDQLFKIWRAAERNDFYGSIAIVPTRQRRPRGARPST
jgi:hypothetical protein